MYETLTWDVDTDGVATLTLSRPDALNAFDLTMARELERMRASKPATGSGHDGDTVLQKLCHVFFDDRNGFRRAGLLLAFG